MNPPPHIRIRYASAGLHTHCSVWSAESSGPDATHSHNGALTFRTAEFEALRAVIEAGLAFSGPNGPGAVEFIADPAQVGLARRDGVLPPEDEGAAAFFGGMGATDIQELTASLDGVPAEQAYRLGKFTQGPIWAAEERGREAGRRDSR